jgi:hypothetical protein
MARSLSTVTPQRRKSDCQQVTSLGRSDSKAPHSRMVQSDEGGTTATEQQQQETAAEIATQPQSSTATHFLIHLSLAFHAFLVMQRISFPRIPNQCMITVNYVPTLKRAWEYTNALLRGVSPGERAPTEPAAFGVFGAQGSRPSRVPTR